MKNATLIIVVVTYLIFLIATIVYFSVWSKKKDKEIKDDTDEEYPEYY